MAAQQFKLPLPLLLLLLISISLVSTESRSVHRLQLEKPEAGVFPPTCSSVECPTFDVVHIGNGYEIRKYRSAMWACTSPIEGIFFVRATRAGFLRLFDYIQGRNEYKEKINMTAPVITEVSPSDGPFCASSFVVSFYVPEKNQANPPPAKNISIQKWGVKYAAVRQFGGVVQDSNVGEEAAALYSSLSGSSWQDAVNKATASDANSAYIVAQYNAPYQFYRVNEIWMMFEEKDLSA